MNEINLPRVQLPTPVVGYQVLRIFADQIICVTLFWPGFTSFGAGLDLETAVAAALVQRSEKQSRAARGH